MTKKIIAIVSLASLCGMILYSSHADALSSGIAMKRLPFGTRSESSQKVLEGSTTKMAAVPLVVGGAFVVGALLGAAARLFGATTTDPGTSTDIATSTATSSEPATDTAAHMGPAPTAQVMKRSQRMSALDAMFNPASAY